MRQDGLAKRRSEVELFSGTVIPLAAQTSHCCAKLSVSLRSNQGDRSSVLSEWLRENIVDSGQLFSGKYCWEKDSFVRIG